MLDQKEGKMLDFLHSKGYTYYTIPGLTYPEISLLVEENNRSVKEQNRQMRLSKKRGKR